MITGANYVEAIRSLEQLRPKRPDDLKQLGELMLKACQRARDWDEQSDPYHRRRERDRIFVESGVKSILSTVRKLAALSNQYDEEFDRIVWRAVHATGISPDILRDAGFSYANTARGGESGLGGAFVRALLKEMEGRFDAETDAASRISVKGAAREKHRWVQSPLLFPKLVDVSRSPDARRTGLLFELTFYLRRFTAGRQMVPVSIMNKMPAYGDTHYDISALFVHGALGVYPNDGGEAFEKALSSNTGPNGEPIRWWGWGKQEEEGHGGDVDVFAYWPEPEVDDPA
ncbi:hypothetical protein [Mesorhizobium sophorae]|uniref:hypothetical protein n=1 Tax=Mesorhizobium sophorae TaxID=1300294 RepID=UPI000BA4DCE6|nr:hypothetical protein [Mesorhizobium sophorae]